MKKMSVMLVLFFVAIGAAWSQDPVSDPDEMPEYPGGMEAMVKYMGDNIEYPKSAAKEKIEGTVFVQFIIDKSGDVTDVGLAKGVSNALDTEAMRVVQSMPNWTPGVEDGKKVAVKMVLPVKFLLPKEDKKE